MKFTLQKDGKEKIYSTPTFVSGLVYRKLLEMQKNEEFPTNDPDNTDKVISLICEAYGNQFSVDEFWEGINAPDVNDTIWEFVGFVNGVKKETKTNKEEDKGK
ncbi:phage tail assembly chaperone G [Domibacillus aminovorans]|uniref:Phage protein n=1 Tax=Domibacillus aminovorans TaxID=29332 RepID=A0A177L4Q5_9BACI|nr:hypothetical protein [Domibacillus aminovorans]OAH60648.1 hypothetical protein AWH49_15555 [Domibacillus aminovorans]